MSGFKKLLSGKRKTVQQNQKQETTEPHKTSLANLSVRSKSGSSIDLIGLSDTKNGYVLKDKDLSKISKAVWQGDLSKLKSVISKKKKINWNETDKENRTVLHLACAQGFETITEFILSNGANVNMSDAEGKTPLMKACEQNNAKIVECLLKHGAETNVFDLNHVSAMHIAAAQGNIEIGMMLADRDAKLDVRDKNLVTPLHLCCALGNKDFADFLLTEYVAVNCIDSQKRTPLMAACIDGHEDIVELLLENNADVSLVDKDGLTAYQLAESYKNPGICAILKDHSMKTSKQVSPRRESPLSKEALFSPVAKSLNEMFSLTGSSQSCGSAFSIATAVVPTKSIFGGPAVNVEVKEKSEESNSDDVGENSWADSVSENLSELQKKPKGLNFSKLIRKNQFDKDPPFNQLSDTETKKLDAGINGSPLVVSKKNIPPLIGETKNDPLLKLSMKNDIPLKVPLKQGKKLNEPITKAVSNEKVLKPVEPTIPAIQADFEGNSLSQSDASDFSDLPISDFNRSNHDLIDEGEIENKFLNHDESKNNADISIGPTDSKWDSDDSEMENSSMHQNDLTDVGFKINDETKLLHKDRTIEKIDNPANNLEGNSIFEDNEDSSWDSEQSEAIQSHSNEQGNKFKFKLSDDEDSTNEHKELPERINNNNDQIKNNNILIGVNDDDSDNDLDILLSPVKPTSSPIKVSSNEKAQASKDEYPKKEENKRNGADDRKKSLIALGIFTSTEEEESESEWEIEQRKRKEFNKINQQKKSVKMNGDESILHAPASIVINKSVQSLDYLKEDQVRKKKDGNDVKNENNADLEQVANQIKKEIVEMILDSSIESSVLSAGGDLLSDGEDIEKENCKNSNLDSLYKQHIKAGGEKIEVRIQKPESTIFPTNSELSDDVDQELKGNHSDSFDDFSLSNESEGSKFSEEIENSSKEQRYLSPKLDRNSHVSSIEPKEHFHIAKKESAEVVTKEKSHESVFNNMVCKTVKFDLPEVENKKKAANEVETKASKYNEEEKYTIQVKKEKENPFEKVNEISNGRFHNEQKKVEVIEHPSSLLIAEKERYVEEEFEKVKLLQKELLMKAESVQLKEEELMSCTEKFVKEEQILKTQLLEKETRLGELEVLLHSELKSKESFKKQLLEMELSYKNEISSKEETIQSMIKAEQASQELIKEYQKKLKDLVDSKNEVELKLFDIIEMEKKLKIEMESKKLKEIEDLIKDKDEEFEKRLKQNQIEFQKKPTENEDETKLNSDFKVLEVEYEKLKDILQVMKEEEKNLKENLAKEEAALRVNLLAKIENEETTLKQKLYADMKVLEDKLHREHEENLKALLIETTEHKIHENQLKERIMQMEVKLAEKEKLLELKEIQQKQAFEKEAERRESELTKVLTKMELDKKQELATLELREKEAWEQKLRELEKVYKEKEEFLRKNTLQQCKQNVDKTALSCDVTNPLAVVEGKQSNVEELMDDFPKMHTMEKSPNKLFGSIKTLEDCLAMSKMHREVARNKILAMTSKEISRHVEPEDFFIVDMDATGKNPMLLDLQGETSNFLKNTSTPKKNLDIDGLQRELEETKSKLNLFIEKSTVQDHLSKEMEYDITEMHRTIELLSHENSDKERSMLDLDLQLRSVKYKLDQEGEGRMVAEKLCQQLSDQLDKSNLKVAKEIEERQSLEHLSQQALSDLKLLQNQIHKLESEKSELKVLLEAERKSRTFQEELYKDQLHQHELILNEARKSLLDNVQAISKLHILDETKKQVESSADFLKIELAKANVALSTSTSQYDELKLRLETELNSLQKRFQTKSDKLVSVEKDVIHLQMQLESEKSKFKIEIAKLQNLLENEKNQSQRFSEEIDSLKNRLKQSDQELEKVSADKLILEKQAIIDREKGNYEKVNLEKDLLATKDQLKCTQKRLESSEFSANSLNEQLQSIGLALSERKGEFIRSSNEVQVTKEAIQLLEEKLKNEQASNSKLTSKLEREQESHRSTQSELLQVKKDLEQAKEQLFERERLANEKQENMSSTIMSLKNDILKERSELMLKNQQNVLRLETFENKLLESDSKLKEKNAKYQKLLNEVDLTKLNLSNAESKIQALNKERDEFTAKNLELEKLIQQLRTENNEIEHRRSLLEERIKNVSVTLDKTLLITDETTLKLAKKSTDIDKINSSNIELQQDLNKLKRENMVIEINLREEKAKAELLIQDLRVANEARESLEELLANAKGNNAALEEKLHSESLYRSQREREAEEHKGLWESELKSRSKLGVKILGMEKEINELKAQIEEEKRKTRRAIDLKKAAEGKIEIYELRSEQHHQEVLMLRNKLKQYQKKLKAVECGESRIQSIYAEFDKERQSSLLNVSSLKRQLDQLSERLEHEQEMRANLEKINQEQTLEITDLKSAEKAYVNERERLEKSVRANELEVEKLKNYYECHYIPREEIEEYKRDMETKARLDVNKKLQEVNLHLEEQSLAREAFEKIRIEKEVKARKVMEETISQLKMEISTLKTNLFEGLAKRDTSEVQAQRFKALFEEERSFNEKINEKLEKTSDRLNLERNRTDVFFEDALSKVSKKLFDDSPDKYKNSPGVHELTSTYLKPTLWSTLMEPSSYGKSAEKDYANLFRRRNLLS